MFNVAFTVNSEEADWKKISFKELMIGFLRRLPELFNDELEAFGYDDTIKLE